jgi:hypothetical protein
MNKTTWLTPSAATSEPKGPKDLSAAEEVDFGAMIGEAEAEAGAEDEALIADHHDETRDPLRMSTIKWVGTDTNSLQETEIATTPS